MIKITPEELHVLADFIHEASGIYLDHSKDYLIESRLAPLMEELNCSNFSELYYKVKTDHTEHIIPRLIDLISTHETSFFRDKSPFNLLKHKIFPDILEKKNYFNNPQNCSLKIWSAACSSGQEVYSIIITLKELINNINNLRLKVLGTDISDESVAYASYAKFTQIEVNRGLPEEYIQRYFVPEGKLYKINDEIRSVATFEKTNLLNPHIQFEKFDIIFCRNVAIYFTPENRKKLFDNLIKLLNPDGILIIGSTESLFGVTDRFQRNEYHNAVYYTLKK